MIFNSLLSNGRKHSLLFILRMKSSVYKELGLPEAPKKPIPTFLRFSLPLKDKMKNEYPGISYAGIYRKLADVWSRMSTDERDVYIKAYEEDHKKYLEKIAEYKASLTSEEIQMIHLKRRKRYFERKLRYRNRLVKTQVVDLSKPKVSSITPFFYYAITLDKYGKPMQERLKFASQTYKLLSDDEKEYYIKKSQEYNKFCERRLREWELEMLKLGYSDLVRKKSQFSEFEVPVENVIERNSFENT